MPNCLFVVVNLNHMETSFPELLPLTKLFYHEATTVHHKCDDGTWRTLLMKEGVSQGCPLSPLVASFDSPDSSNQSTHSTRTDNTIRLRQRSYDGNWILPKQQDSLKSLSHRNTLIANSIPERGNKMPKYRPAVPLIFNHDTMRDGKTQTAIPRHS
jgi:hypothetical protein